MAYVKEEKEEEESDVIATEVTPLVTPQTSITSSPTRTHQLKLKPKPVPSSSSGEKDGETEERCVAKKWHDDYP
jgi:hypothetical protein